MAFTLVELTMVIAIIAVVSAIAVPRFSGATGRYKLDMAAKRVAGDIERARQEAIATSATTTLMFNYAAKNYTITRLDDLGKTVVLTTVLLSRSPYDATGLSGSVAGRSFTSIKFDGYGKPNSAGTIQINIGNESRILTLNADTGKVTVR